MNAAEILQQLNALDEHPRLEAKKGGGMSEDVLRSVCAFANEPGLNGGWIIFGVTCAEDVPDSPYTVCGVRDLDALQQDLLSQSSGVFNHPIRPQVTVETLDGKPVLVAFIPEHPPAAKPIYFKRIGLPKGAYRRIASSDVACTDDDLSALYGQQTSGTFDASPVAGDLSDVDPDALAAYRNSRRSGNPEAEELRWNDRDLLHALGCLTRGGGAEQLTLAGLVLFGSSKAQRRLIPIQRVDYIRIPSRVWSDRPEQPYQTNDLRGPLLTLVPRIHDLVLGDLPTAARFTSGDVQRSDVPLIPGRVIREAVVNAVMHRSWRVHGPVQVRRFANRLEIANPGYSLKLPEQLGEPGSSTRNPIIAAVLHEIRFAETKGSGIRVMRGLLREAGLSPPSFNSNRDADQFTATLLFHHFLDTEDVTWLQRIGAGDLGDDGMRALIFARETGMVTNADLRELTGLDTLGASACLRRLRNRNLLVQRERGTATYYEVSITAEVVAYGLMQERSLPTDGKPPNLGGEPPNLGAEPPNLGGKPPNLGGEPPNLGAEPPRLMGPDGAGLPPVPNDLRMAIAALGAHAPAPQLHDVVAGLCGWRAMTRSELSGLLGRSPDYLRSHLKTMVDAGRLTLAYPDQPNHPQQSYSAVIPERT
jgi:ATP-dependent DNA helicase RecG